jgi:CheY-like chemotaxis protein
VFKPLEECVILHVEDDDASAYLFQHALLEANLRPRVFRVTNGEDALAFLMKAPPYAAALTPDVVLLDLNLPRKGGLDVLLRARAQPHLDRVRFVVLTTSDDVRDREQALAAGADAFLTKSSDFEVSVEAAKSMCGLLTKIARQF